MPSKEVYLFDDSNNPLKVTGITLELFDSGTGTLLDVKTSLNRKPGLGSSSTEWGADLIFIAGSNPVDIYINDPTYKYPGNAVESLNGQTTDRIDIDLLKLPATPIGTSTSGSTLTSLFSIIRETSWSDTEKQAVINLICNYAKLISKNTIESPELPPDMESLVVNWTEALNKLNIDPEVLRMEIPVPLIQK